MKRDVLMITLIRAGQTVWTADGRIQGAADLPLSDIGRTSVQDTLPTLAATHLSIIHHPPDEAATETARLCAKAIGAKTKVVEELAEPHMGLLEGLTEHEFEERFPSRFKQWQDDPLTVAPPEGEEVMLAAERILKAVAKILKPTRGEETGIVLHDLGLGLLQCWLAGRPLNEFRDMQTDRPAVERYAFSMNLIGLLEASPTSEQPH